MPLLAYRVRKEDWAKRSAQRKGAGRGENQSAEGQVADAGAWQPAVQKIIELRQLGDNWDGLGAPAPSRELLESALGLAYLLGKQGMPPPNCVVPGLDGSVNFEWQDPDGSVAEVEIDRPFHAEVILIEPGKPPSFWTLPTE